MDISNGQIHLSRDSLYDARALTCGIKVLTSKSRSACEKIPVYRNPKNESLRAKFCQNGEAKKTAEIKPGATVWPTAKQKRN